MAKELTQKGVSLYCSEPLSFFLNNKITMISFDENILKVFALLDDYDVLGAIKSWQFHSDFVLSSLCKMIINRDLLKIALSDEKIDTIKLEDYKNKLVTLYPITDKEVGYFVFKGKLKNQAYNKESEPISMLKKDGTIESLVDSSDQLQVKALSKAVTKYFMCFPKVLLDV
jgi:hypothetical protein